MGSARFRRFIARGTRALLPFDAAADSSVLSGAWQRQPVALPIASWFRLLAGGIATGAGS